jgi:ribonuclease BN (tRNA processing enzyme)
MNLRILGCSGGIGANLRTTAMLLDHDVLIDAGTGVGDLKLEDLARIDHVFLTHSHLDHVVSIPFMVDTVGWMRDRPLTVHAIEPTLDILRDHLFNWKLWPDFARIKHGGHPLLRYESVELGVAVDCGGRRLTPLPANHAVPAVGYRIDSGRASLVYTGDTTTNDALWCEVNEIENLRYLIIETAFCDREKDLAVAAKHLCPSMLADELSKFKRQAEIYITHLKPGENEITMREVEARLAGRPVRMLQHNQSFAL